MNNEAKNNLKKGGKAAIYSSLINLLLALVKGVIGFLSGSIALIADSIHSFSDIVASLAVYVGLKLSMRRPDEKFPYGYYKIESFTSLIVSVIIVITGIEIALDSYNAFLNPSTIEIPLVALFVAALSALVSFLLARYKQEIGRTIGSQALINDGKHSFIDIFSSIIVFVGILSSYMGYLRIQGISGILVALLIVYMGLKLAKDDILVLLDANMDPEKIEEIKTIAESVDGVEGVHAIKVRRSGPFVFAELHLQTKKGLSVENASEITGNIKKAVKGRIKNLDSLMVQIEPFKKERLRVAVLVENKNGLQSDISEHFARAPYILIADVANGRIISTVVKDNPGTTLEKKKGIETAEFLEKEKVDVLVSTGVGEGPKYALSDKSIDVMVPRGKNLEEMIMDVYK
ncbi:MULTISPECIES: cation diffusion facilitator family transporter [Methanobacterium]|jgi:cation diffusion facilitator family transporter|uniref:Cation diffusion facilitator family transporter n=1 Tax=Methanobacterium veterum TaxID=408577 RepID=A0A9E5A1X1_9EURY|nr:MULTISPECIES: cation diffusion facilitator family transporter [Methanobacterium]MCZ3366171.1 cation diffusion facilitator family transporter [Methanobacterium veterum]MCZ3371601.1 cation diffusion facilitator family transporter [Methanobacterium veterum]